MNLLPLRPLAALTMTACIGAALPAHAALAYDEALRLALVQAPSLQMQQHLLAGAQAAQPAASTMPDPRLSIGVDNLPLSGADRLSLSADFMTMTRIGLMQDVPNRAKRAARSSGASARIERERAMLAATQLTVQREAGLAWIALHYAEQREARIDDLVKENRLLLDTLNARVAAGMAMPADRTMARQDTLMLADRRDELQRDIAKARATLRRWVGARADEPLEGAPPAAALNADEVRAGLHRHAEIAPYAAMQAMARAEAAEMDAEQQGDWGWEVVYSRRGPQYPDMLSFQVRMDLTWQKAQRQQPLVAAKLKEALRIEAEREETLRKHAEEVDMQLAELAAMDRMRDRIERESLPLAAERVTLATAAYQSARGDLAAVLAARREAIEARLRLIDLDSQRAALRVRLTTLIAE
jgi:outer membrane protein, heavy metal efflux system